MHERIEPTFPPLVKRGRARRREGGPKHGVEKASRIYRAYRAEIIADRGGQQDKQGQARFDQFRKIG